MPTIKQLGVRTRYSVEKFDGGYNSKEAPSRISPYESPDCLNVVFDDRGGVETRPGSRLINTSTIGSVKIDGGIQYNNSMIAWAGGTMYRATMVTNASGGVSVATFVPISNSTGKFATGVAVASVVYQNVLFCSDGTNGPWKYTGPDAFAKQGITVASACTASGTSAGSVSTGTYYYKVSFVNSQLVEGQAGSMSAGVTIATTSTIGVTGIPTGGTYDGVLYRRVYRCSSTTGTFLRVGTITDNVTTTFADTVANGAEGVSAIVDGTAPTPYTTIEQGKERLWFDDSSNRTLLRWTDFENPYISQVENFEPLDNGDGYNILAVAIQDNFVAAFKAENNYTIYVEDPADETTWIKTRSPSNIGIVGPRAFAYIDNAIAFMGRQNGRLTGLHILSGKDISQTSDGRLRTDNISEKIEYDLLRNLPSDYWDDIAMGTFERRLYIAYTTDGDSFNRNMFWLDLNRLGSEGQPGSWSPWRGINASCFFKWNGHFYAGSSNTDGKIFELNQIGVYSDTGSAIDSYYWTKEVGGETEGQLDSYIKDFRRLSVWHAKLGNYNMNIKWRIDGDAGSGYGTTINLASITSLWGTLIWGSGVWGAGSTENEEAVPLGRLIGKRIQVRFDNQNTVNQGFKVYRLFVDMNLRRFR